MAKKTPRPYQQEAIDAVFAEPEYNTYLIALATGLGKSFVAAQIYQEALKRYGANSRLLWCTRQTNLTTQAHNYFQDFNVGYEMGTKHANGQQVILANIQSIVNRLDKYKPDDFAICVFDEAAELPGRQYRTVAQYFKPKYGIALSATPGGRADGVRLDDLVKKIVYGKDLLWGIQNNFLCPVKCKYVKLNYDLSNVRQSNGDYVQEDLQKAMQGTEQAIAEIYQKHHKGVTIIFASGVEHAKKISELIPNSKYIIGETPEEERQQIINDMNEGKLECCVSVNIFIQGIDIPRAQCAIFAKPSNAQGRLIQSVGRVLRTHPEKDYALLIDTVGVTDGGLSFPNTLLGYDIAEVAKRKLAETEEELDLLDIPEVADELADVPETWIKSIKDVDIWAKKAKVNTHNINLRKRANGSMVIGLPNNVYYSVPPVDMIGNVTFDNGKTVKAQEAIDMLFKHLMTYHKGEMAIWSKKNSKRWGNKPMTQAQERVVTHLKGIDLSGVEVKRLSAMEASVIIGETKLRKKEK